MKYNHVSLQLLLKGKWSPTNIAVVHPIDARPAWDFHGHVHWTSWTSLWARSRHRWIGPELELPLVIIHFHGIFMGFSWDFPCSSIFIHFHPFSWDFPLTIQLFMGTSILRKLQFLDSALFKMGSAVRHSLATHYADRAWSYVDIRHCSYHLANLRMPMILGVWGGEVGWGG